MKVLAALRAKPNGKALADRLLTGVRVRALAKLEHVRDLFPHFTDHAIRHSEGVVTVLDWLMPDTLKKALNEWELYFLVAAAYLHDIGMVEGCPGPPSGEEWDTFLEEHEARQRELGVSDASAILLGAKREFVRDHHHERSEQYIRDHWVELELRESDNPGEGQIVGRLALGHREVDLSDRTVFGEVAFGVNQLIRRDLLAAYLRLADELDTTAHRTPWAEYEILTTYDEASALEWAKHLSLFGVSSDQGVIILSGECRDHGVYLRLRRLHADIRDKLAEIRRMLPRPYATGDEFIVADALPYHDVDLNVEHVGYLPIEVKFELQDREIIELIMGQRLYGDATASLRELLQNAVDTCREAREQRPSGWVPRIEVREEDEGRILSVTDNGMGMDEYIVRQYFSRVGISYYTSPDFQGTFKPISEFGIGVLSCFMMADRIQVDSKREGQEPIHLEIRSLTEPFVPKRGSRTEPGTAVRLHLKPDAIGSFDLAERVAHFAKHVEFPLEVKARDGQTRTVADEGLAPNVKDLASLVEPRYVDFYSRMFWASTNIAKCHCVRAANGVELGVTLMDPLIPGRNKFGSRLSQLGFLVGPLDEEFCKFAQGTWCELSLSGNRVLQLTADRTRAGRPADEIWRLAAELYSEAIEELYQKTVPGKSPGGWWRYHLPYYPEQLRPVPQALLRACAEAAEFCTMTREGFRARHLHEISDWSGPLYWVQPEDHGELERIRNLLAADACVVAMPTWAWWQVPEEAPWYWHLVDHSDIRGTARLTPDVGASFRRISIDGHRRCFMDAGVYLGKWRISWKWVRPGGAYPETVFDAQHPFSRVLLKSCTEKLPRKSSLIIAELFRSAYTYSPQQLQERHREAFQALKDDGLIASSDTFSPAPERSASPHECPYGRYRLDSL